MKYENTFTIYRVVQKKFMNWSRGKDMYVYVCTVMFNNLSLNLIYRSVSLISTLKWFENAKDKKKAQNLSPLFVMQNQTKFFLWRNEILINQLSCIVCFPFIFSQNFALCGKVINGTVKFDKIYQYILRGSHLFSQIKFLFSFLFCSYFNILDNKKRIKRSNK